MSFQDISDDSGLTFGGDQQTTLGGADALSGGFGGYQ